MSIRFEGLADHIDEAVKLFVSAYAEPPWNEEWSSDLAHARLTELIVHPGCLSVAAFDENHLTGFAIGTPHTGVAGTSLYIGEIVVEPTLQRQGIGRAILGRLELGAAMNGFISMWLVTERVGTTKGFYAKSSFKESPRLMVLTKSATQERLT
jgi:Acetyltransferases